MVSRSVSGLDMASSILTGGSVSRRLRAEFTATSTSAQTRAASLFEDEKIFYTASLSVGDAVVPSLRRHPRGQSRKTERKITDGGVAHAS